jgi:hypothetical protein
MRWKDLQAAYGDLGLTTGARLILRFWGPQTGVWLRHGKQIRRLPLTRFRITRLTRLRVKHFTAWPRWAKDLAGLVKNSNPDVRRGLVARHVNAALEPLPRKIQWVANVLVRSEFPVCGGIHPLHVLWAFQPTARFSARRMLQELVSEALPGVVYDPTRLVSSPYRIEREGRLVTVLRHAYLAPADPADQDDPRCWSHQLLLLAASRYEDSYRRWNATARRKWLRRLYPMLPGEARTALLAMLSRQGGFQAIDHGHAEGVARLWALEPRGRKFTPAHARLLRDVLPVVLNPGWNNASFVKMIRKSRAFADPFVRRAIRAGLALPLGTPQERDHARSVVHEALDAPRMGQRCVDGGILTQEVFERELAAAGANPTRLQQLHARWVQLMTDNHARLRSAEMDIRFPEAHPLENVLPEGVTRPMTERELQAEGADMHHCVGSYAGECRAGRAFVYRIAAPQLRATLMTDPTGQILQVYGPCNRSLTNSEREWMRTWFPADRGGAWLTPHTLDKGNDRLEELAL